MRVSITLATATAAALLWSPQVAAAGVPGGYSPTKVTKELASLLTKSLRDEKVYSSDVTGRVCVTKIMSVEQQVVAGMNYRFTTSACDVPKTLQKTTNAKPTPAQIAKQLGKCTSSFAKNCVAGQATVTIYQSFDDSVQVSGIEFHEDVKKPAKVHVSLHLS